MFHGRCQSLETILLTRIQDLEEQLSESHAQKQELIDRIIAITNPIAYSAMAGREKAAAAMPVVQRRALVRRPGRSPILTPTAAGHRPSQAQPAPAPGTVTAAEREPDDLALNPEYKPAEQ